MTDALILATLIEKLNKIYGRYNSGKASAADSMLSIAACVTLASSQREEPGPDPRHFLVLQVPIHFNEDHTGTYLEFDCALEAALSSPAFQVGSGIDLSLGRDAEIQLIKLVDELFEAKNARNAG